ncbi:hypothetical protein [Vibrio japonicus]|uniref:Molecular chaperone n=1 Tax=Vibrio japonicus TaxID=1824638 RepID=A0ABY5LLW9_9VIBR|nr:hypothetical protein [Vibrio japonicus]UUM31773.1 hypothetical protein NP165_06475 [Vibrio japonicus]
MALLKIFILGLTLLTTSYPTYSIILSPSVLEYSVNSGRSAQITVVNNTTQKLPLETSLLQLAFKKDGSYGTKEPKDESLIVLPPAAILTPGATQVFRVQWIGAEQLPESKSYFVRFTQPSLYSSDSSTGIALQIHYNALLHVSSDQNKPSIVLNIDNEGAATLENQGSKYTYSSLLEFSSAHQHQKLKLNLKEMFLPPRSTFHIPNLEDLSSGEYVGYEQ